MKSLAGLETERNSLNLEREANLRKIDLLHISLDESNTTVKVLQKVKVTQIEAKGVLNEEESSDLNKEENKIVKIESIDQPSQDIKSIKEKRIEINER